jgi:hypothetical protein
MQIVDEYGRSRQITPRQYYDMTGRIDARPRNPRYMGGLNNFYALQNRGVPAFADPRRPGMSAGEMAEDAAGLGLQIGPQGLRPTMGQSSGPPLTPTMRYAQGMTADEIRQANIDAAKKAGTFEAIREKFLRENEGARGIWMSPEGSIYKLDDKGEIDYEALKKHGFYWQKREDGLESPDEGSTPRDWRAFQAPGTAPAPVMNPGAFIDDTPAAASAKAREKFFGSMPKRDGTVAGLTGLDPEKLRPSFDALPTPPATKPAPIVETSAPVTAAQRRQMLADAEMGRMEKRTDGRISEIQSKYGKGTSRILKPGEARPVAMTTDEFGKPETMKSFLERRKFIQQSKGMT